MANNKSIQLLRGTTDAIKNHEEPLLDGQPLYDKDRRELYIGDGQTNASELSPVVPSLTDTSLALMCGAAATNNSIAIGYNACAAMNSIAIGENAGNGAPTSISIGANTCGPGIAIGENASACGADQVAIGSGVSVNVAGGIAIGHNANAAFAGGLNNESIAIGCNAKALAGHCIQLGEGENSKVNSFQVWNYELMNSSGYIPHARMCLNSINVGYVNASITNTYCLSADAHNEITLMAGFSSSVPDGNPNCSVKINGTGGGIVSINGNITHFYSNVTFHTGGSNSIIVPPNRTGTIALLDDLSGASSNSIQSSNGDNTVTATDSSINITANSSSVNISWDNSTGRLDLKGYALYSNTYSIYLNSDNIYVNRSALNINGSTITFPRASGTVALLNNIPSFSTTDNEDGTVDITLTGP